MLITSVQQNNGQLQLLYDTIALAWIHFLSSNKSIDIFPISNIWSVIAVLMINSNFVWDDIIFFLSVQFIETAYY